MAKVEAILELHQQGWSQRRIAQELLIDRETVGRYVQLAAEIPKPAGPPYRAVPPAGSEREVLPAEIAQCLNRQTGSGRRSRCEPHRAVVLAKLEQGLSAQRVYQDLTTDHGYQGSYDSVKRFVRGLGSAVPLPMRRMECDPGTEAQVDFGTGAPVIAPDGKRRKTHVFRVVLSHSRKAYSEVTYRQTTEDFLRCLENAFQHFGGVPQTLVIDNLRAAVSHPDWFDPELNPKLQSFSRHYGTVILPTKPYMPRHKGKIERGIGYVKGNALKGRTFPSLEAQNLHLANWEATVADLRIHGTTRQQVGRIFAEVERSVLRPLPSESFPFFHEAQRIVNRDGHVEVAKAYYSVPPEYLGRTVWVRWDAKLVHVFNHRLQQIAVHTRHEAGRFSTQSGHIPQEKVNGIERGAKWLLIQASKIGPHAKAWSEAMFEHRGIEGLRVLQGLLSLARRQSHAALETACETALSYGAFRLRTVRELVNRQAPRQELLPFLDEHPIIRPLSDYGQFVAATIWTAAAPPRSFTRHDTGVPCPQKEPNPGSIGCRGSDASGTRLRSGYPSPGCSSAGPTAGGCPGSVSPDDTNVLPFPSPEQETPPHE
jgi:transposase